MSLKQKLLDADTRDIMSIGALTILGWGVYTHYFAPEVAAPIIALVFGFWFGQKSTNGG